MTTRGLFRSTLVSVSSPSSHADPGRRDTSAQASPGEARLGRQLRPALLSALLLTALAGAVFPLVLLAISATLFPYQAGGSLIVLQGAVVGSRLIGQDFTRPEWFQPRPSAAGDGYNGTASGGTNLEPNNPKLKEGAGGFAGVRALTAQYRLRNGLAADAPIPIDAVTRSGSGLDPDISPANALLQIARVARVRGLDESAVRHLVTEHTEQPQLGFLGESRVSVLELNLALERLQRSTAHASEVAR